ncbi:MAG: peptide MFS transporter [Anaeromyxobacter sp.]|nr:peptide MFS transporter [Anaeromyxobacter sp.]MBL0278558.1 peptide MFS transporter [Anaeromyxobacter sp.]
MQGDRAFFGHPRGLGLIFVVEMWERFSYYGMRALLVLYLVNGLQWDKAEAARLYGTYTSLVYLTPLIGGYLADRLIGTRRSMVLGSVIIALGHFALAMPGLPSFYAGLGLIIVGTGFFKPNAAAQVGQMYAPGDSRRDAGFTIFYMGVNAGAAIGPLVCGYLAQSERWGWHYGFGAAGVGMVLGLLIYLWGRDRYMPGIGVGVPARQAAGVQPGEGEVGPPRRVLLLDAAGGAAAGGALAALLGGLALQPVVLGAAIGGALAVTVLGTHGEERRRVLAIFLAAFFVVFFWAAYEQAGSSMNLFADKFTDLTVGGFDIPSSWFQSVNPTIILVFGPVFAGLWGALARRGKEPPTALKMVFGLALLGVGFLFLVAGGARADAGVKVSPIWLLLAYSFHTFGELCLSPVGLSYVSKIAPARFASLLLGAWYLANATANKIAGALAAYTPTPGQAPAVLEEGLGGAVQRISQTNAGFFSIFVVTSLAAAGLMLLCVPLLRRLTSSVKA